MHPLRPLLPLLLAPLLAACIAGQSERAAQVRVVPASAVAGFVHLGQVAGTSLQTGIGKDAGYANARNELLDNAAALGATHVVLTDDRGAGRYWALSQKLHGEAYRQP